MPPPSSPQFSEFWHRLGSGRNIIEEGPSSGDFDSGVDNQQAPSKYIVWYPDVKTHVLLLYAVTVKMDLNLGGALIVASTLQIVVGFSGLCRNVTRFVSPLSAVPLVALSGFCLYELGFLSVTGNQVAKLAFHNAVIRGSDAVPSVVDNKLHLRQQPEQRTLP
ncbi:uncharacterized protein A4U43_C01F29900 [Asparagus officinalis]|uniref:Uncharacterized protein n=1 Tax=Asparagus officinalis TaxID=4686 RepID=A0A5P1FTF7_ASPOF|nr:uncharacterized protein A4U43_C01F29900 [Asparagus officinalis]